MGMGKHSPSLSYAFVLERGREQGTEHEVRVLRSPHASPAQKLLL